MIDIHISIDHMQLWTMRYKGTPLYLPKMMKPKAVELRNTSGVKSRTMRNFHSSLPAYRLHMHECLGAWMSLFTCM